MVRKPQLLQDIYPHAKCWVMPCASYREIRCTNQQKGAGAVDKDDGTRTVMNVVWIVLILGIVSHAIPGFPPVLREYMLLWVIGASLGVFISRIRR